MESQVRITSPQTYKEFSRCILNNHLLTFLNKSTGLSIQVVKSRTSETGLTNPSFLGSDSVRNLGTCNAPCASIDTHFGIPDTQESRKGSIHLKLYFKQLIAVKESHVSYPLESLFAELGGYGVK